MSEATMSLDEARDTVAAAASILMFIGSANPDKGNVHLAVDWLGRQLDLAWIALDEGKGA